MKSSFNEMDLEEWEVLPDEGFLEIHDDGMTGNKVYSRKYPNPKASNTTGTIFHMNYFISPHISDQSQLQTSNHPCNQLVPLPIYTQPTTIPQSSNFDAIVDDHDNKKEEMINNFMSSPAAAEKIKSFNTLGVNVDHQDPVSQVFFKKMKDNEFVDMKMDSPKSNTNSISRGINIMPQIDGGGAGTTFKFDEEKLDIEPEPEPAADSEMNNKMELDDNNNNNNNNNNDEGGLNILKWSSTGIGAICSFGVAAATFCIVIFSSAQHHKINFHHQKPQFQIFTHAKGMKQVVQHQQEANSSSVLRGGIPVITRSAHITVGGYYDAPTSLN